MDISYDRSSVRAYAIGLIRMEPLPESSRCEFTIVQKTDLKGYVPTWIGGMKIKHSLSTPSELNTTFDRGEEIDATKLSKLAATMEDPSLELYSDEEVDSNKTISDLAEFAME